MSESLSPFETKQLNELEPTPAGSYDSSHHTEEGTQYAVEDRVTVIAHPDDIATLSKGFEGATPIETDTRQFTGDEIAQQGEPVSGLLEIRVGDKSETIDLTGKGYLRFTPNTWQSTWGSAVSGYSDRGLTISTKGEKPVFVESVFSSTVDNQESPTVKSTQLIHGN